MYYMETAMGQFARTSPLQLWRCAPIMQVKSKSMIFGVIHIFKTCRFHNLFKRNGKPTLFLQCLYKMSPLNHKRTTSSLAPPIFYVAKKIGNLKIEGSPLRVIATKILLFPPFKTILPLKFPKKTSKDDNRVQTFLISFVGCCIIFHR